MDPSQQPRRQSLEEHGSAFAEAIMRFRNTPPKPREERYDIISYNLFSYCASCGRHAAYCIERCHLSLANIKVCLMQIVPTPHGLNRRHCRADGGPKMWWREESPQRPGTAPVRGPVP